MTKGEVEDETACIFKKTGGIPVHGKNGFVKENLVFTWAL